MVEHACGMATLQTGEFIPNASNGIDTYSIREPLGVCAGICPMNFPAMTPLWVCLSYPYCFFPFPFYADFIENVGLCFCKCHVPARKDTNNHLMAIVKARDCSSSSFEERLWETI